MSQDTLPMEDLEDGELEDGEWDDDGSKPPDAPAGLNQSYSSDKSATGPPPVEEMMPNLEPAYALGDGDDGPARPPHDEGASRRSYEEGNSRHPHEDGPSTSDDSDSDGEGKSRKKRKKSKRRKKEKEKKKRKRPKYKDHDRIDDSVGGGMENEPLMNWSKSYQKQQYGSPDSRQNRSPAGPYDSPDRSPDYFSELQRHRSLRESGGKGGGGGSGPPPGPYDSPYDSPPGLYDSPSDEDYDAPPRHKKSRREKPSMLSMLGDNYMDANVAANEKEEMFHHGKLKGHMSGKQMKKMEKRRMYKEMSQQKPYPHGKEVKKRSLLGTPKDKPFCKFYMDGKCSKGMDCPFSHDIRPSRKMEVCKFYITNECLKGSSCLYLHSEYPCKYFHTGAACYAGDNCKFSHDTLTEETAALVDKFPPFALMNDRYAREEATETAAPPRHSPKKRGLLGTPPREEETDHDTEAAPGPPSNKKIPSLFDIQVFPPTRPQHSAPPPQAAMPSPPPGGPPPGMRPRFYNDMTGPPPGHPRGPGPGPGGMMGPGPRGPRGMMPPHMMGGPPPPHPPPPGPGGPGGPKPDPNTLLNMLFNASGGQMPPGADGILSPGVDPNNMGPEFMAGNGNHNEELPIPAHLPKMQQDLFMRIKQRQKEVAPNQGGHDEDGEPLDDNWYSSDEESGPNKVNKQLASNLLQSLQHSMSHPPPGSSPQTSQGMDINAMLSVLSQQVSSGNPPPGQHANLQQMLGNIRDPRMGQTLVPPKPSDPRLQQQASSDPRLARTTSVNVNEPIMERTALIDSCGTAGTFRYKLVTIDVDRTRPNVPSNLNRFDPKFKDDPRIKRAMVSQPPLDPRMQRQNSLPTPLGGGDSRMVKPELSAPQPPKPMDPRSSHIPPVSSKPPPTSVSDTMAFSLLSQLIPGGVPGMQKAASAPMIVPPVPTVGLPALLAHKPDAPVVPPDKLVDPRRAGAAPTPQTDPRLARQISTAGSESEGSDCNTVSQPTNKDPLAHRTDPRFRRKSKTGNISVTPPTASPPQESGDHVNRGSNSDEDESQNDKESRTYNISQRKSKVEYASPLGGSGDAPGEQDGYNSYNRKPNSNVGRNPVHKMGGAGDAGSTSQRNDNDPNVLFKKKSNLAEGDPRSKMLSMPLLPEQMQMPPVSAVASSLAHVSLPSDMIASLAGGMEPSVKDVFKTLDPTASPFC